METDNENKGFKFIWILKNFNFCWHKTGEALDSPEFCMNYSPKTSWKLRLYPRGEYDGEYISCFLCREKDGPEIVNVDFQLFLKVGDSGKLKVRPPVNFSKIYSFKRYQMEGLACFASRRELFALTASRKERLTLFVECTIFRVNGIEMDRIRHFSRTNIVTERISGTEVFDDPLKLEPENCTDVDVKPLVKDKPLIGINVSCLPEILVIKINPKTCDRIKYAICKITLVNELTNRPPVEYVRCWIGKIKTHIWGHKLPCQDTESVNSSCEFILPEALILHYDFEFSTGAEPVSCSWIGDDNQKAYNLPTDLPDGYMKTVIFTLSDYLNIKSNTTTIAPTALDALKYLWASGSYSDFTLGAKIDDEVISFFKTHKALLCARSGFWKSTIKERDSFIELPHSYYDVAKTLLEFLYTDSLEDQSNEISMSLYLAASYLQVENLKRKCKLYSIDNLHYETAGDVLGLADILSDSSLKAITEDYIIKYLDLVQKNECWTYLSKQRTKLLRKTLLLNYRKKETRR